MWYHIFSFVFQCSFYIKCLISHSLEEDVLEQSVKPAERDRVLYSFEWTLYLFGCKLRMKLNLLVCLRVSLQLVRWATSSRLRAPFPARCVPPTAGPARRDRVCVNVAADFTGQPMMPTLLPAQVSFVGLFVNAWLSGRCSRGLHVHFSSTQNVRTELHRIFFYHNIMEIYINQQKENLLGI